MDNIPMIDTKIEKKTSLPSPEEIEGFIAAGYDIDLEGRPLHPNLSELGVLPTGKGAYWGWGPNYTADPLVLTTETRPRVLLIHRSDTGDLALPGGFVDKDELQTPITAAYRELEEETGLVLTSNGALIYKGIVDDPRTTANAWPETSAYLFNVAEPLPVQAGDDAKTAGWYFVDELPENLYGSHAALIEQALKLNTPRTIEEILSIPAEEREIVYLDAGHMAYQHYFTRHQNDRLFVKAHDSSRFTDTFREEHSRQYLEKEYAVFHHVEKQGFNYIPARVALIDDTLLAMDALQEDDGYWWRAPKQGDKFERYVSDALEAFSALQTVTPPENPEYHKSIKDTYSTMWEEGWDSIDDESLKRIVRKIRELSNDWSIEQQKLSEGLIDMLPTIQRKSMSLSRDEELYMAHNDARQSNIAWHPEHGTKLVDWSWADRSPKDADATMFLIDLVKSGSNIDTYLPEINQDYAHVLIGFWLAHSLWQTRDGSQTVREHQVASAIAAYKVLNLEQ